MASILCSRSQLAKERVIAEKEAAKVIKELRAFYSCDVQINIVEQKHILGWSLGAELLIDGEIFRKYEVFDLCLYDLNALMLNQTIKARRMI